MQQIYINPESVFSAAGKLHIAANKVGDGRNKAKSGLSNTGGLPPEFQGRASALAGRAAALVAMDAIAVCGVELTTRGRHAAGIDGQSMGIRGPLPMSRKLAAFSENLKLWNSQTRSAARSNPGRYFNEINAILGIPTDKKAPKAGFRDCKFYTAHSGYWRADAKIKSENKLVDAGKDKETGKDRLRRDVHDRNLEREVSQLTGLKGKELQAYLGYFASAEAGRKCSIALGDDWELKLAAALKATAKLGATGSVKIDQVKLDAGLDLSAKLEVRGSLGRGNSSIGGSGALVGGLKAKAHLELGINDAGVARFRVGAGLAVVVGLEGAVDVAIDTKDVKAIFQDSKIPLVVPSRAPSGVLHINQA